MYDTKGGLLCFFQPSILLAQNAAEVLKNIDIGASSADHGEYICFRACIVKELHFTMTEEAASGTSVAPTVVVTKRVTPLSSSGAVSVATITVPTGTAIGKIVRKKVTTPVRFAPGESMHIAWVIGTGTPTGIGTFSALFEESPETLANNSDMVESA